MSRPRAHPTARKSRRERQITESDEADTSSEEAEYSEEESDDDSKAVVQSFNQKFVDQRAKQKYLNNTIHNSDDPKEYVKNINMLRKLEARALTETLDEEGRIWLAAHRLLKDSEYYRGRFGPPSNGKALVLMINELKDFQALRQRVQLMEPYFWAAMDQDFKDGKSYQACPKTGVMKQVAHTNTAVETIKEYRENGYNSLNNPNMTYYHQEKSDGCVIM